MSYVVVVTYGTRRDTPYATVPDRDSARKLQVVAKRLGYTDARIEDEESFLAAQDARRGGPAGSRRAAA